VQIVFIPMKTIALRTLVLSELTALGGLAATQGHSSRFPPVR
jgi:hypothetical protein